MTNLTDKHLRALGGILCAGAVVAWYWGLDAVPLSIWKWTALFPPHYILGGVGAGLALAPDTALGLLTTFVPEKLQKWIASHRAGPDLPAGIDPVESPKVDVAGQVQSILGEMRRLDRRYYRTIAIGLGLVGIAIPLFMYRWTKIDDFSSSGQAIARVIQARPITFASADEMRRLLVTSEIPVRAFGRRPSATLGIYEILKSLYGDDVTSDSAFARALTASYEERVADEAFLNSAVRQGDSTKKVHCKTAIEPTYVCQSYLTLLAAIAISQGSNGRYLLPYFSGRALAEAAIESTGSVGNVPAAYQLLGIASQNLARQYGEYKRQLPVRVALDGTRVTSEAVPVAQLTLLRNAEKDFSRARDLASGNFNRARYFNNTVDLRLELLTRVVLDSAPIAIGGEADRVFVRRVTGLVEGERALPRGLGSSLQSLLAMLDTALTLSKEPSIYFTRAQVLSVAGEAAERGLLVGQSWANPDSLVLYAHAALGTARAMGLPESLFSEERATGLHLSWLRTRQVTLLGAVPRETAKRAPKPASGTRKAR